MRREETRELRKLIWFVDIILAEYVDKTTTFVSGHHHETEAEQDYSYHNNKQAGKG